MNSRLLLIPAVAVVSLAGPAAHADTTTNSHSGFSIGGCELRLKPEAGHAYFASKVLYNLTTDAAGWVIEVVEDPASKAPPPFRPEIEPLTKCLKTCRLQPSMIYKAELQWCHAVRSWSWSIRPPTGDCIRISVPR